ncbi:MAG: 3'-5' exonuclease, partial [Arenicella sp.]|nr:3'-5' exonuclease [Arenicella sp.]
MLDHINDALFNRKREALSKRCTKGTLKQFLETPTPTPSLRSKLAELEFLVADLEMTGLDPKNDKILSIGTTLIKAKEIDHSYASHQLVFQDNADLTESAPIHRIFNQDVVQGVPLEQALNEFLSQLSGRVLVLHNATLDKSFLNAALTKLYGIGLVCRTIDTMQIERRRLKYQG